MRKGLLIIDTSKLLLAVCLGAICELACLGQTRVLANQVGYEVQESKQAIVSSSSHGSPGEFALVDSETGKIVLKGSLQPSGRVDAWGEADFSIADFSSWKTPGQYILQVSSREGKTSSCPFAIESNVLERNTLSNIIYYLKGQRASGLMDKADRHLQIPGSKGTYVDVHGGWYDATGDYGINLSHQNPTSFFNPQQTPLVVWSLLTSYKILEGRHDDNFSEYERRMLDEGLYGADFLVRIKRPNGSFFETISAPGKEKMANDRAIGNPNWRTRIKTNTAESTESIEKAIGPHAYEASFRAGGGMSIAALALASTMPINGDFPRTEYLKAAEEAFRFLDKHNRVLLNDGVENILDDYCILLATTELYGATHKKVYRAVADRRANQLMERLIQSGPWKDYWRADAGIRPFFHPSDAGLPVISLLEYARIATSDQRSRVRQAVGRSLRFELGVTAEVNNPFGYARQLVRMGDGKIRTAFFFPHDSEAAPWWQGENARLASLAAAARMAVPLFADEPEFQSMLRAYAWNQLHWILGRNPFDTSMLIGSGHGNAAYMFFRSYKYTNAPGAIVNGITASLQSEDGISFNQGFLVTGKDEDWRWTEEWLPHASWYLYAISLPH